MKLFCAILLILSFLGARIGRAEVPILGVEDLVRRALTNSPALRAARLAIEEARGRMEDSGRLANPELESSFAPHFGGGERSFSVGFNQRFPVTARLRLEKRISRIEVALASAEVAEFSRQLTFQVRTTAITLAMLDAQQRLNEQQQSNSREMENAVRQAATAGESSELDLAHLELEVGRLHARRAQLETSRSELIAELSLLTGMNLSADFQVAAAAPVEKAQEWREPLIELRPDIVAAQHRAEAARAAIKLARANRWQEIEIGIFTEIDRNEDAPTGIQTDHIAGVRLAIPIPLWNRGSGRIAEAEAKAERAEAEAAALLTRARTEVAAAARQLEIAKKHASIVSAELLPKARTIEERLSTIHKQGQAAFADVLRARERRLELEYSELDAQRAMQLAQARYLAAIGVTAEKQ
jgi:cobalt-zinc-cadmium efflux system outer membrane protein